MEQAAGAACVKLSHSPYQIFKASKTPGGLYARQKWLGESDTPEWQDDFHETVLSLTKGQSEDGSWNQSPAESIRRLFGLHLTLRHRTGSIEKALDWLMTHTLNRNPSNPAGPVEPLAPDALRELPFTGGGRGHFTLVCATLFLAAVFQRGSEPAVMTQYGLLSRWVAEHTGDMDLWPDMSNALRALIAHPEYRKDPATAVLVGRLDEIQGPSGCWPDAIPFFQTVNAIAHLHLDSAHRQWVRSLTILSDTQNVDGSWGDEDREWNTFLVVHALKNKACL